MLPIIASTPDAANISSLMCGDGILGKNVLGFRQHQQN